jgi:hypothetical protein
MTPGSILSFDGSWSHRRGANDWIVVFIDCRSQRIVDFEIVQRPKAWCSGNYQGSSNGMEVEGLRRLITRGKANPAVVGCVHDSDSKATKAIRDAGWDIEQYYDPNHISKCFDRKWAKVPHNHLRGLAVKIRRWFNFLGQSDFSPQEKLEFWMNTVQHFTGDHTRCPPHKMKARAKAPLANKPEAREELQKFLEASRKLITRCRSGLNTQLCEAFNSVKARYADKSTSWKISWQARTMCAIMQMNNPEVWRWELFTACDLAVLDPSTLARVTRRSHQRLQRSAARRTPDVRARQDDARTNARAADRSNPVGRDDYRMQPSHHRERDVDADSLVVDSTPPNADPL